MRCVIGICVMLIVLPLGAAPCGAELYKYKKDGVWYFTDSPPREMVSKSTRMVGSQGDAPAPSAEGTPLLEDYPARTAVEKAVAATVAVKSGLGYGSGFFISTDGYILTNKHVVRTTAEEAGKDKNFFEAVDNRVKERQAELADEKHQLEDRAARLREIKEMLEKEKDPLHKKSYENEYAYRRKIYESAKADYEKRLRRFEEGMKDYQSKKSDYEYGKTVANLSQSFEIILADNTRINGRLVATSADHDLALLKLDGYKTPALKPSRGNSYIPGLPLYAIGNPAKLRNSVTSGVMSGYENGFIKTNAQIYPGNSGGPLITFDGKVAGINTFKQLTRKYEGLGFAIPIDQAFAEFSRYLH